MSGIRRSDLRKVFHQWLRRSFARLPRDMRFAIYRYMVDCDPEPDQRLELKIAETQDELEQCFRILHDAYVGSGFMKPVDSGMRVTLYHALPTTTTLCAKYDGRVVGTISMIREGVFGFPLQSVFDLSQVRAKEGNIAEISALAVHTDFRRTGGAILFPLMKFMYTYCTEFFDTRHLVIAVNPNMIELYESLLFFERLQENTVASYDFANGAPAVGATLDLHKALEQFRRVYARRRPRKNLYKYFVGLRLPNIKLPKRRYFTTNDPVMKPAALDYFFNQKSACFAELDDRKRALLWSIYDMAEYRSVLPMLSGATIPSQPVRRHQRFSVRCPATVIVSNGNEERRYVVSVIELSLGGFQALCRIDMPEGIQGRVEVDLGADERSTVMAQVVRRHQGVGGNFYGFKLDEPDPAWRKCVGALETGNTMSDL